MNKLKLIFGIVFGLLIWFAVAVYLPSAKAMWLHHSGAVIPNGSHSLVFTDKPFRLLSVNGQRWVDGKLLEASAYHVLVIFPAVIPQDMSSSSGGDRFSHTATQKWLVPTGGRSANVQSFEGKELTINYDALWQTVALDNRTYHLKQGNLFVVRFDQNWQLTVTQLNVTMNAATDDQEEIDAFKSALKDDPMVRQL
jgi:hypothetical protein